METNRAIKTRQSVRKFTDKKPNWRDIIDCVDTTRYTPMAGNNFSMKFIIVDDKEKIKNLADCCEQNFISEAHFVVVVCTTPSRTTNTFEEKGKNYLKQQAGAT